VVVFIRELQCGLYSAISAACDTKSTSVSGIKEALKLVLIAARTTKRLVAKCGSFANIWDPMIWTELHHCLLAQDRFMASAALVGMCKQVAQLVQTQQALLSTAAGEFLERKGRFDEETVRNKRKAGVHAGVDVRVKKVKRVTAATQDGKKASD
jgi:hypothetical protein